MQYSTNYNMNKPELAEQYRLSHWNENTDIIDSNMKRIDDLTGNLQNITDSTFKTTLLNFCYPVGSLYWSSKSTNPATLFGGTWVQIKDRFILACGDTYTSSGATGGASTVTLSVDNMPSHTHSFTPSGKISSTSGGTDNRTGGMSGNSTGSFAMGLTGSDSNNNWCVTRVSGNASRTKTGNTFGTADNFLAGGTQYDTVNINVSHTHTAYFTGTAGTTGSNGSGTSFSILPPYVVKYCFERTA